MRAVFDTNTVVSALLFGNGRLAWLREAWRTGISVPLVSRGTTDELLRGLGYQKFGLSEVERDEVLADYLPFAEVVIVASEMAYLPHCRDENDQKFIALAATANVTLVAGDGDLLALVGQLSLLQL